MKGKISSFTKRNRLFYFNFYVNFCAANVVIENALQVFYAPRMYVYGLTINLPYNQYLKKNGVNIPQSQNRWGISC